MLPSNKTYKRKDTIYKIIVNKRACKVSLGASVVDQTLANNVIFISDAICEIGPRSTKSNCHRNTEEDDSHD